MVNRKSVDRRETIQVRIDRGLHRLLKKKAKSTKKSIKELLEESLTDLKIEEK